MLMEMPKSDSKEEITDIRDIAQLEKHRSHNKQQIQQQNY